MNHFMYYLFSISLKYGAIALCAYFIFFTALPQKTSPKRRAAMIACLLLYAVGISLVRDYIHPFQATVTLVVFTLIVCMVLKIRLKEAAALSLLSVSGSYAAYFVATISFAVTMVLANHLFFPQIEQMRRTIIEKHAAPGMFIVFDVLTFLAISLLQILLVFQFLRSKRIKKGLAAVSKYGNSAGGLYISILIMTAMTAFTYLSVRFPTGQYSELIVPLAFFFIFSFIFWIRHEIHAVYLLHQRDAERRRMQQSLADAEAQKAALQEDNRRLAAIIDKDGRLLPAMVQSARDCVAHIDGEDEAQTTLRETALRLEEIHAERMAALAQYRQHTGTSDPDGGEPSH